MKSISCPWIYGMDLPIRISKVVGKDDLLEVDATTHPVMDISRVITLINIVIICKILILRINSDDGV
jgi:hypothetical protein